MLLNYFENKKVGIWGMGREGKAVKKLLTANVKNVSIVEFEENDLTRMNACDVVVKSPGVSLYRSEIKRAIENGVEFTSATNIFMANKKEGVKIIAVTGTKGKSTTSSLLAHTLKSLGVNVGLGGNIGVPLVELLDKDLDMIVAEVSSYQAADFKGKPDIGILLNLYPEHLQWHGTHAKYYADKINMINQCAKKIVNGADKKIKSFEIKNPILFNTVASIHVKDGFFMDGRKKIFPVSSLALIGEHNAINACAVLRAINELGYDMAECEKAFMGFQALPHRLETVGVAAGITFVDDSISTTPETAVAGLKALPNVPITLIAGGQDRGQDFDCLVQYLAGEKNRIQLVTLPDTGDALYQFVRGKGVRAVQAFTMQGAVAQAKQMTPRGGVVLLSPAAPSYNMYVNFEARGDDFKKCALK